MNSEKTLKCSRCQEFKLSSEFCKNRSSPTGYGKYCKLCLKARHKETYVPKGNPGKAIVDGMLACCSCGELKPVEAFNKNRNAKTGYSSRCKSCTKTYREGRVFPNEAVRRTIVDGRLVCGRCKTNKDLSEFTSDKATNTGYSSRCKSCAAELNDGGERIRPNFLLAKYNMTLVQYDAMFEAQGGLCACCGQPEKRKLPKGDGVAWLCVDHDHRCCPGDRSCGKCVRALLCTSCNLLVGHVEATPMLVLPILDYLDRFGQGPLDNVDVLAMLGGP